VSLKGLDATMKCLAVNRHSQSNTNFDFDWGSWKGTAIQGGFEPGSRVLTIVRSRYQATTNDDTAAIKKTYRYFVKFGNSDSVTVICSNDK
jgi:hypothetical protein